MRAYARLRSPAKAWRHFKAAEPHWTHAQREVERRVGVDKLEALIETLGELESLHPDNTPPAVRRATRPASRAQR